MTAKILNYIPQKSGLKHHKKHEYTKSFKEIHYLCI